MLNFFQSAILGKASGFNPLLLGAKLEFWFDNDDASKITLSGSNVSSQVDKTGNYTRSVVAPAAGPAYNPSGFPFTDKGRIVYAGAEGLKMNTITGFNHQQGEIFVVMRRYNTSSVGLTNNQLLMCVADHTNNNNFLFASDFANGNSQNNSIGINSNLGGVSNIGYCSDASAKSISDKKTIVNFRSNGSAYGMGFDRDLSRTKTFNVGDNGAWFGDFFANSTQVTFGYRTISSGTAYSTHYEYEVIYFNQELTSTERANVLTYLNNKHDCYRDITYDIGVVLNGSSNGGGQSIDLPNRLKVTIPKSFIRTASNTFTALLFGTNNEGDAGSATNFGAEMSFMAALSEYFNRDIYMDKFAVGGSRYCIIDGSNPVTLSTDSWNVAATGGGARYAALEEGTEELQTKMDTLGTNKIILFIIGGENDTFYAGDANGFETNVNDVIDGLTVVAPNITHFIFNRIKSELIGTGSAPTRQAGAVATVQAALESLVTDKSPNAVLLDMVNYTTAESVHFRDYQHVKIGRDAFELIKEKL